MSLGEDFASAEIAKNIAIGKQKKEAGDEAFKTGDTRAALRSYHESLLYLKGTNKQSPAQGPATTEAPPKEKTEVDILLEKIYNNMCMCHLKHENWKRALETADKALTYNENNFKALFRKGKAYGEMGYFEKAEKVLADLLKKNPSDGPTITAELTQLRAKDKERERKHNAKMKGFLSRDKTILSPADGEAGETAPAPVPDSAKIEEVIDVA